MLDSIVEDESDCNDIGSFTFVRRKSTHALLGYLVDHKDISVLSGILNQNAKETIAFYRWDTK